MTLKMLMILASLVLVLWLAGFVFFLNSITAKTYQLSASKHDAIIVLTGGANRINSGLDLLNQKKAPLLFISGTDERVTSEELIDIWGKSDNSNPPCCIVLGRNAKNTKGNAIESYQWISNNSISSIILVTAYYHMPRSIIEFSSLLGDINIEPYPVGYYGKNKIELDGWFLLAGEYNKYMWVYLASKM